MWSPLNALIAIDAGLFSRYKCCGSGSLAVTIQTTFLPNKWGDLVDVVEKSSGDTLKRKGEGKGRVEEGKGIHFVRGLVDSFPPTFPSPWISPWRCSYSACVKCLETLIQRRLQRGNVPSGFKGVVFFHSDTSDVAF